MPHNTNLLGQSTIPLTVVVANLGKAAGHTGVCVCVCRLCKQVDLAFILHFVKQDQEHFKNISQYVYALQKTTFIMDNWTGYYINISTNPNVSFFGQGIMFNLNNIATDRPAQN